MTTTSISKAKRGKRLLSLRRPDIWTLMSLLLAALLALFLVYPIWGVLKQSVLGDNGELTLGQFGKFFGRYYYSQTIIHSLIVSIATTVVSLVLGIPFAYFYTYYRLRGAKLLFTGAVLSCMSAPFIGAYAWVLLFGRHGIGTRIIETVLPVKIGSIYGFHGIVLTLSLKLFPLVAIYMNSAFRSVDRSFLEAASLMGSTGLRRIRQVTMRLTVPTLLAASLLVFMRAFSDFGTPLVIGESYKTFPVEIYEQYVGEIGVNHKFASAIGMVGVLVTAAIFLFQRYSAKKFSFSLKPSRAVEKRRATGLGGVVIYAYMYLLIALAMLPQLYIVYLSFRNNHQSLFLPGYSLESYREAASHLLTRSIYNTIILAAASLAIIILVSLVLSYLVVRRPNSLNSTIDTISMMPYIMPGAVIGIGLVLSFNSPPIAITGTLLIMVIALVVRRMPYTLRSATATLMHIPPSVEEAARSLKASKLKAFGRITAPMMASGIASGAILSFVSIVTEMSSAIILYNNQTITLTMSAYVAITRGNFGQAAAFSAILTVVTTIILGVYLKITPEEKVTM